LPPDFFNFLDFAEGSGLFDKKKKGTAKKCFGAAPVEVLWYALPSPEHDSLAPLRHLEAKRSQLRCSGSPALLQSLPASGLLTAADLMKLQPAFMIETMQNFLNLSCSLYQL